MALVRRRALISGRVQGVFFRGETADRARSLGIAGWVRNLPDGRVEAVFEGEPEKVDEILAWTRLGPAMARVDEVVVEEEVPSQELGFRVR